VDRQFSKDAAMVETLWRILLHGPLLDQIRRYR
jgi:hypothetical protein